MVGNEAVAMGCQQFFEEQNIPYKIEPLNDINGDVYKVHHMWRRSYVESQLVSLVVWGLTALRDSIAVIVIKPSPVGEGRRKQQSQSSPTNQL